MRPYRVSHRGPFLALSLLAVIAAGPEDVHAQDPQTKGKEEPKLGWSNTSDLSLVVTGGNSESQTLGFSDKLRYQWKEARLEFKVNVVRANKSDDRFFLVAPGLGVSCRRRAVQSDDIAHQARAGAGCRQLPHRRRLRTKDLSGVVLEHRRQLVSQRRRRHPEPVHRLCAASETPGPTIRGDAS